MPLLRVINDDDTGTRYALSPNVVIGRAPDCGLVLEHQAVSRRHARIVQLEDTYYIEDINSRNGTQVNGQRLAGALELGDGDSIKIAGYKFQFELRSAPDTSTVYSEA